MPATDSSMVRSRPTWTPAGLSFGLHLILLVALAWLVQFAPQGSRTEPVRRVLLVLTDPSTLDGETLRYLEADPAATPAKPEAASPPLPDLTTRLPPPREAITRLPESDFRGLVTSASDLATSARPESSSTRPSDETLRAIAAEQAELARLPKPGPLAQTSIFGSQPITGRRFVFVLDRSKSMGSQGLNVLGRASAELLAALAPLTPEHSFQVIAYHLETVSIRDAGLLPATEENKNLVREFVDNLAPFGSTNHEAGLYMALRLEPDAIILLTDGDTPEMNDGQIQAVVRLTRGKTTIHAVQFGTASAEPAQSFMSRLARQSGGSYRYFSVNAKDCP